VSRRLLLAVILAASMCASAAERASKERYLEHVKTLSSARMEGRGAGTKGLGLAEAYLIKEFRALGLKPAGTERFRQPFTVVTGARLRGQNVFTVGDDEPKALKLNDDFIPLSISGSGTATGQLVFAGYGVSAAELGYDDYLHLDVRGKLVVVLRKEPPALGEKAGTPGKLTSHAEIINKAINARAHGAKGLVLVNASGDEDTLLRFAQVSGPEDAGIPIVHVRRAVAEKWFAAGKTLASVQADLDKLQPGGFAFEQNAAIAVDIERTRATVANVLGYLPGRTDEYIIIGAHYDHLGLGDQHSLAPSQLGQVHHGADDNASGTAGLLEVARLFVSEKRTPERGILFAAFAGEELGLLGSSRWVNNPTLPIERATAMLNMDMVGRMSGGKLYIGGVGTGSTFRPMLEKAAPRYRFTFDYSSSGYGSSDHTSFVIKRVPSLFFFSGLHSDYHKPSDTWEKIDAASAAQLVDLVRDLATEVASGPERPQFVEVVAPPARGEGVVSSGYGAYFGSVPDFGEQPNGVKFADVRPDSPAAKAGLKPGDVLIQFGDLAVKNLYDFTFALRQHKPGDVVQVKVLRDGQEVTATVTLERRR
jgi:hypothetical protein